MQKKIKTTPLHKWHMTHGANMASFGGYDMPLWYPSGAKQEHLAVLTSAGIFDTSHMAVIMITGTNAWDLLQRCLTKDLNTCVGLNKQPLTNGRCSYGAFLDEQGNTIDDAIVYMLEEKAFMIIVNAGMGGTISQHLTDHSDNCDVNISDLSDNIGKMDIQGPMSAKILSKVLKNPKSIFDQMPYFSFKGHFDDASPLADTVRLNDGTPLLLSRTGYTGEFGFEIFLNPVHLVKLWEMLLEAGNDCKAMACGLAARDSLRAGAMLPLSHQDIGPWPFINHPWHFALPFNDNKTAFTKKFIGNDLLMNLDTPEYTYAFAGYDLRKVLTLDPAIVVNSGGDTIGFVTTCVTDMAIGRHNEKIYSIASPEKPVDFNPRGLSCGFVRVKSKLVSGESLELRDKRRKLKVMIVNDIRPDRTARHPIKEMI